jgi:2-oxoglutarate ferredoxin oxidoreductase subunit delta
MPDETTSQSEAAVHAAKADIVVDLELCKACGICISLCPTHVFDTDDGGQAVAARPEDCTVCRLCEWHCPDFAIEVLAREKEATA